MEGQGVSVHYSEDSNSLLNHELFQQGTTANTVMGDLCADFEIPRRYYEEYKRVHRVAYNLAQGIHRQAARKDTLLARITSLENQITALHKHKQLHDIDDEIDDAEASSRKRNNKRMRRTAEEIQRKYYCIADFCDRCYGSEGSLQQHIKLKHPDLYKPKEDEEED